MSDMMLSTVRVAFEGDPEGLIGAYEDAASAAQTSMDRLKSQASQASDALEAPGSMVQQLTVRLEDAGEAGSEFAGRMNAAASSAEDSLERVLEPTGAIDDALTTAGGTAVEFGERVTAAADSAKGSLFTLDGTVGELGGTFDTTFGDADAAMALFRGDVDLMIAKNDELIASLDETAGAADKAASAESDAMGGWAKKAALAMGAVAGGAVYLGMKWQTAMTQLVTGAGESQKNIAGVSSGLLSMSGQVATSTTDLAKGMYMVESAGFHGAAGLSVLKASAEGAKVGASDLETVANAVTSTLKAYGMKGAQAASVTSELVATVAAGKMHMQDLAGAMAMVLPVAASSHIAFSQVGGAIATMTAQGMTARRASTNLANVIRAFIAPTSQASDEMRLYGINASQLSLNVGKVGLTGTLDELTSSILKNTKGGLAMAAGFTDMGPAAKGIAEQILAGATSTEKLSTEMESLNPVQAQLVSSFETTAKSATGVKQTYDSAMKTMVGGSTGLNAALLLTGGHLSTFKANVASIQSAADTSGSSVKGFSKVQGDLAFQLDSVKDSVEATATKLGTDLIPILSKVLRFATDFLGYLEAHKVILVVVGAVIATILVNALRQMAITAWEAVPPWIALNAPLLIIIATIAAVAAAAYEIYTHWKQIWPLLKKTVEDVIGGLKAAFNDVRNAIIGAFKDAGNWLLDAGKAIIHGLFLGFEYLTPAGLIIKFHKQIIDALEDAGKWLLDTGKNILHGLWTGFEYLTPAGLIIKFHKQIIDALEDAGKWLLDTGKNIVEGLKNGILHAWGSFESWVKGKFQDLKNWAHDILGIFSPSKVFDSIGRNIMLGLAQGITTSAPQAHAALATALGAMNPSLGALSIGGALSVPPQSSGSQGGQLIVNLEVDGMRLYGATINDLVTVLKQRERTTKDIKVS